MAVRRTCSAPELAAFFAAGAGANCGIRRDEQGSEDAWIQFRRIDHLLRLHAGSRNGERPCCALFPLQSFAWELILSPNQLALTHRPQATLSCRRGFRVPNNQPVVNCRRGRNLPIAIRSVTNMRS